MDSQFYTGRPIRTGMDSNTSGDASLRGLFFCYILLLLLIVVKRCKKHPLCIFSYARTPWFWSFWLPGMKAKLTMNTTEAEGRVHLTYITQSSTGIDGGRPHLPWLDPRPREDLPRHSYSYDFALCIAIILVIIPSPGSLGFWGDVTSEFVKNPNCKRSIPTHEPHPTVHKVPSHSMAVV